MNKKTVKASQCALTVFLLIKPKLLLKIHQLSILYSVRLVEARGVEPLSEDHATPMSTGVVTVLMSPERRPVTDYALGQPDCLLPSTPGGDRAA